MAKIQIYTTISFWNSQVNIWISVHFLRLCQYLGGCYCFRWDSLWTPPFDCCLLPWELLSSFRKRQTETLAKKVCAASVSDVKVLQAPSKSRTQKRNFFAVLIFKDHLWPHQWKSFQNKIPFNLSVNTQNHLYTVPLFPPIWTFLVAHMFGGCIHVLKKNYDMLLIQQFSLKNGRQCLQTFILWTRWVIGENLMA